MSEVWSWLPSLNTWASSFFHGKKLFLTKLLASKNMPPWEYFYRSVNLLHFEEQNFTVHQIAAICDDIYIEDLECRIQDGASSLHHQRSIDDAFKHSTILRWHIHWRIFMWLKFDFVSPKNVWNQ